MKKMKMGVFGTTIACALLCSGLLVGCGSETVVDDAVVEPTAVETEAPEPERETPKSVDSSGAILPEDTELSSPAPLGQFVDIALYATDDKTYHKASMVVDKITTQAQDPSYVASCVDQHNSAVDYDFQEVEIDGVEIPEDIEFCIIDYTITIPEEFPGGEFGIGTLGQPLYAKGMAGGGIPTTGGTYVGLGQVTELLVENVGQYQPGETYALRGVYAMVKDYEDYAFDLTTYHDGDASGAPIVHAYFASR